MILSTPSTSESPSAVRAYSPPSRNPWSSACSVAVAVGRYILASRSARGDGEQQRCLFGVSRPHLHRLAVLPLQLHDIQRRGMRQRRARKIYPATTYSPFVSPIAL